MSHMGPFEKKMFPNLNSIYPIRVPKIISLFRCPIKRGIQDDEVILLMTYLHWRNGETA